MVHISSFVNDNVLTGGFLDQSLSQPTGEGLFGTSTAFVTSTGSTISTTDRLSSLQSSFSTSFNRILDGLQSSNFLLRTQINELALGQASIDISKALNEQIVERERQRAVDNETVSNQQIQINVLNERLSKQVQELGESLSNIGQGGFDPIKFFTDNPLIGGIGIGGLAVAAVVLFVVLK